MVVDNAQTGEVFAFDADRDLAVDNAKKGEVFDVDMAKGLAVDNFKIHASDYIKELIEKEVTFFSRYYFADLLKITNFSSRTTLVGYWSAIPGLTAHDQPVCVYQIFA